MSSRNTIRALALGLILLSGAACAAVPPVAPTASPTVTQPAATAAATATSTRAAEATAAPAATATVAPEETPGPISVNSNNIFHAILRAPTAPAGWTVEPCAGDGPFLCVQKGQEDVGAAQLSIYPIETMPDFAGILETAGLPRSGLDPADSEQAEKVGAALEAFVDAYHTSIEADRQLEYGDAVRYERLETERIAGELPWLKYGFRGVNADGSTFERWVSYVGYDGDLLRILVAAYRPEAIPSFRADAELLEFLPHLDGIVAGLRVPLPVLPTEVASVRALRTLDIFRAYSAEAGNPVGQVAAGETVRVTGVSPTGRHWRVNCPDPGQGGCWIAGTADATEPAAR